MVSSNSLCKLISAGIFVLFQLTRLAPFRPEYLKATEALYAEHRNLKTRMANR